MELPDYLNPECFCPPGLGMALAGIAANPALIFNSLFYISILGPAGLRGSCSIGSTRTPSARTLNLLGA